MHNFEIHLQRSQFAGRFVSQTHYLLDATSTKNMVVLILVIDQLVAVVMIDQLVASPSRLCRGFPAATEPQQDNARSP
jgi:hypothetical protein